jgi:alkanesulfonate monooxygenase SsuD/methylene tetrahydromethanopterin reductase-like flavin-dependent oxidoreductase (luciferase family)
MENHGTDPNRRFRLMRERVEAMKAIWTEDEAAYHGTMVDFDAIWSWPKPVQKPHPPVLVGGNGDHVLDRVIAFGDEWMPNRVSGLTERVEELNRMAEEAGRGPIPVTLSGAKRDRELIERADGAGIHRCTFYIEPTDAGETERQLDELASELGLDK